MCCVVDVEWALDASVVLLVFWGDYSQYGALTYHTPSHYFTLLLYHKIIIPLQSLNRTFICYVEYMPW